MRSGKRLQKWHHASAMYYFVEELQALTWGSVSEVRQAARGALYTLDKYNQEWMNNPVSMDRMWLLTSVSRESSLAWFDWRQQSASEQPVAVEFPWVIKEKEKLPKIIGWHNWFGKCSETENTERGKAVAKVWHFLDLSSLRKHPDLLLKCSTKYI